MKQSNEKYNDLEEKFTHLKGVTIVKKDLAEVAGDGGHLPSFDRRLGIFPQVVAEKFRFICKDNKIKQENSDLKFALQLPKKIFRMSQNQRK